MANLIFDNEEQVWDIICGDNLDFICILDEIIDNARWRIDKVTIVQNIYTYKFYSIDYSIGVTELQPYREYASKELIEVKPHTVEVIEYKPVVIPNVG